MTDETLPLAELLAKAGDGDLLNKKLAMRVIGLYVYRNFAQVVELGNGVL